jgi:PAS domain S-box-containing protein
MVLTDRDLRILLVNREFANLHGLTVEEAVGRPLADVVGIALDRLVLDKWLSGPLKPGDVEVTRYSKAKIGADGVPRIYNLTAKPVTDETGLVRQIVFLGVDDTQRRDAEKALADADRLATVGEMAATVVHEISQPLQVINIAAASALDEVAEAAERGHIGDVDYLKGRLERITRQVERTARIIDDLRAFVRGTSTDNAAPFDVADVVGSAVDLASHTLRRAQITLLSRIGKDVPPVVGYSSRLEQVVSVMVGPPCV